jgi:PKD repeat protein
MPSAHARLLAILAVVVFFAVHPAGAHAAPSTPEGVTVTATTCTEVRVSWAASQSPGSSIFGYKVLRNGVLMSWVLEPNITYTDKRALASSTYTYAIAAVDQAGFLSASSAPLTVRTPACSTAKPPSAPTALTATPTSCSQIALDWAASLPGDAPLYAYKIYQDGAAVTQVSASVTNATRGNFTGESRHSFAIAAVDTAGYESPLSATVDARTPACSDGTPPRANAGSDQTAPTLSTVNFNGQGSSDPDGSITAYAWNFGDGASGTGSIIGHAYAQAGVYTATLTVTDNDGLTATDSAVVTVVGGEPTSSWLKTAGGAGSDIGHAVTTDRQGNVFVAGRFYQRVDFGTGPLSGAGSADAMVAKYTAAGVPVWSRRLGGNSSTVAEAVATDGRGDVVVAGWFMGSVDLGAGVVTGPGGLDIFVAKYAGADGRHLWSRSLGGIRTDAAYGVAADTAGNVVLTGTFQRTVDFGGGPFESRFGGLDVFVAKYAGADGRHLWSKSFWNYGDDIGYGVAVDGRDDVVIAGFFGSSMDFGTGQLVGTAANNAFVAKFAGATGTAAWARGITGSGDSRAYDVAVDASGHAYAAGFFDGTANLGGGPRSAQGVTDSFVIKYDGGSGAHLWSTNLRSDATDAAYAIAVGADNTVALAGHFRGGIDFGDGALTSAGRSDVYVAALSGADGRGLWSDALGGAGNDYGYGVTIDSTGRLVLTGYFTVTADLGVRTASSAGSSDFFVLSVAP